MQYYLISELAIADYGMDITTRWSDVIGYSDGTTKLIILSVSYDFYFEVKVRSLLVTVKVRGVTWLMG